MRADALQKHSRSRLEILLCALVGNTPITCLKNTSASDTQVDQAALMGEFLAVEHHSHELIHFAWIHKQGHAEERVAATGASSYLQMALLNLSDHLSVVTLVLVDKTLLAMTRMGPRWPDWRSFDPS